MADTKISALTGMTGAETVSTDVIPIVDVSVPQTKKITRAEFFKNIPALAVVDASTITVSSASAALQITQTGAGNALVVEDSANPDSTPFVVDASGNVGIGLSSPAVSLDIGGQASPQVRVLSTTGAVDTRVQSLGGSSTGIVGTISNHPVALFTNNTEKMRITAAGNVGIATTSPLVPLDVNGSIFARSEIFIFQPTPTSKSAAATLTIAELLTDIIQYTGAVATLTAPLATDIVAGLPTSMPDNTAFDFSIINTGTGVATLAGNTGTTLIGSGAVTNGTSGMFRLRRTSATTVVIYRLA